MDGQKNMEPHTLYQALEIFEKAAGKDQPVSLSLVKAFLLVARQGQIAQKEIVTATGLTDPTVTRISQILSTGLSSKNKKEGGGGLQWVSVTIDPDDWRGKILSLTKQGKAIMEKINRL